MEGKVRERERKIDTRMKEHDKTGKRMFGPRHWVSVSWRTITRLLVVGIPELPRTTIVALSMQSRVAERE